MLEFVCIMIAFLSKFLASMIATTKIPVFSNGFTDIAEKLGIKTWYELARATLR
jgi:hypothetical protein